MSTTDQTRTTIETVTFNLYRDIHKGIRSELFAVTGTAGGVDPADADAHIALAARVTNLATILEIHAEDEEREVQPAIETYLPDVAEVIVSDHARFDRCMDDITALADATTQAAGSERRIRGGQLYLELAAFTGMYLAHQDIEERVVMPALDREIGPDACFAIHLAIIASLPPEQLAKGLAIMLPAMNIEDRVEVLGGMKAGAPAEVFADVWALAGTVLVPEDLDALGTRLGLA